MTVELRPLGVTCNLACQYCYQNPQRDAGNTRATYDLEKMKAAARRIGGPFTLFGGEPLMMPLRDLDHLFAWGLETHGRNAVQTNGVLIEAPHVDLFRRYRVSVGISIDGPGALNDVRRHRAPGKTRPATERVMQAIERLCREHEPPGLIVTLHRGNATQDKLPAMFEWLRGLDALGIKSVRLHLLEVDHPSVRDELALSAGDNIRALLAFAELERTLPSMRFDLFSEMRHLLAGRDAEASCTWRACDPYTTEAVQGVEGDGQTSNCGRTNKDGVGFIKAERPGYERYLALFDTPQSRNGCAGCRFFLMCKGQCPGTAIDGDWRNRTEHCQEWMHLFTSIERGMLLSGQIPLTLQPMRFDVERRLLEHWRCGENPSLAYIVSALLQERLNKAPPAPRTASELGPRFSWVSDAARSIWEPRIARVQGMLEDMTVHLARREGAALRLVATSSLPRLLGLADMFGLSATVLPADVLPGGVCTRPGGGEAVTLVLKAQARREEDGLDVRDGAGGVIDPRGGGRSTEAGGRRSSGHIHSLVAAISATAPEDGTELVIPESTASHPLLALVGLHVLPTLPGTSEPNETACNEEAWLRSADAQGYRVETEWLRDCLSWPVAWSEINGIVECKTPVFKLTLSAGPPNGVRRIRRAGSGIVEAAATGLCFPFSTSMRRSHKRPGEIAS